MKAIISAFGLLCAAIQCQAQDFVPMPDPIHEHRISSGGYDVETGHTVRRLFDLGWTDEGQWLVLQRTMIPHENTPPSISNADRGKWADFVYSAYTLEWTAEDGFVERPSPLSDQDLLRNMFSDLFDEILQYELEFARGVGQAWEDYETAVGDGGDRVWDYYPWGRTWLAGEVEWRSGRLADLEWKIMAFRNKKYSTYSGDAPFDPKRTLSKIVFNDLYEHFRLSLRMSMTIYKFWIAGDGADAKVFVSGRSFVCGNAWEVCSTTIQVYDYSALMEGIE